MYTGIHTFFEKQITKVIGRQNNSQITKMHNFKNFIGISSLGSKCYVEHKVAF